MPLLEKWSLTTDPDLYLAPEMHTKRLHGTLVGDSRLSPTDGKPLEGREVTTSSITALDLKNRTAQTRNTFYNLGEPDPEFAMWTKENRPDLYEALVCAA
jgi:hypothetical protein